MLKRIISGAIVLGALALYISQVELKKDALQARSEKPFAEVTPSSIRSVRIEPKDGAGFTLVQSEPNDGGESAVSKTITESEIARWGLDGITGAELDLATVNTLVSSLQSLVLKDGISASDVGEDRSAYGLAPAELKVTLGISGSEPRELAFGKMNDYVGQRYLQLAGDSALYLVPSELYSAAAKKRDDFRNRLPLIVYEGDVKELTLADPQTSYVFSQGERWAMSSPQQVSVSSAVMTEVFRAIRSVRAVEFIDDASSAEKQSSYGLTSPAFTVKAIFKDEKRAPFEARFGRFKKEDGTDRFAVQRVGSPFIVIFDSDIQARVLKGVNDYREKQLASFDTGAVKSVTVTRGDSTISIVRNQPTTESKSETAKPQPSWTVDGKLGDEPFITGYFTTLSTLEAKEFLDPTDPNLGFEKPEGTIELTMSDGKVRKLVVGRALDNERRVIGVDKLTEPFVVEEEKLKRILPAQEVFLEAAPAPTEAAESSSASSAASH